MKAWGIGGSAVWLIGCASPDEAAIQHRVMAELIERYQVSENMVHIVDRQWTGAGHVAVNARVDPAGRAGAERTVRCLLRQEGKHWVVERVEEKE